MDYREKIAIRIPRPICDACGKCHSWDRVLSYKDKGCPYQIIVADKILNVRIKDCETCGGDGNIIKTPIGRTLSQGCPDCNGTGFRTLGDILDLLKAGKLVELDPDQSLPVGMYHSDPKWHSQFTIFNPKMQQSYNEAQDDMLKAGWVKGRNEDNIC